MPQALINNQRQTIRNAKNSLAVEAKSCVERFVGREQQARERDKLVFRKTVLAAHIEYKKGNFFLYWSLSKTSWWLVMRNTFSIEGVFLAESQYAWWCGHVPCLGAIDTSASTYRYCLYLWTKYYERELSSLAVKQDNRSGWGKKKKIFFLFPFSARSIRALTVYQCQAPSYPALSMCMPLTIRVW